MTDFGAVGDGVALNTKVLQDIIDRANREGGGVLLFPEGKFLTGTLELKSGVTIFLEENSVLLGSTNLGHYRKLENPNCDLALLSSYGASNISIKGKGTIDGRGLELALNIDSLYHAGKINIGYNNRRMRPLETERPSIINFVECKKVLVRGVCIKDASSWVQRYRYCKGLVLDSITVNSVAYWNNDGIDIDDSQYVQVTNSFVNSADDGICLKSHNPKSYVDSVYIANCTIRSSASAIKFGTASYGGFKNIKIENIKVYDTFRSAIAIESVDGGIIENVHVDNIEAKNTGNPIFIRLGHRDGTKPGTLKNITIKNVMAQVPFGRPDINYDMRGPEVDFFHNPFPSSIVGIPGHSVENVILENIEITYPGRATRAMAYVPIHRLAQVPEKIKDYPEFSMFGELPCWGIYVRHVKGIKMNNIHLHLDNKDYRPAFVFDSAEDVVLENIKLPVGENKKQIILEDVLDVSLDSLEEVVLKVD